MSRKTYLDIIPRDLQRELQLFRASDIKIDLYPQKKGHWAIWINVKGFIRLSFGIYVKNLQILIDFLDERRTFIDEYSLQSDMNYPGIVVLDDGAWDVDTDRANLSFVIPSELALLIEQAIRRKIK